MNIHQGQHVVAGGVKRHRGVRGQPSGGAKRHKGEKGEPTEKKTICLLLLVH